MKLSQKETARLFNAIEKLAAEQYRVDLYRKNRHPELSKFEKARDVAIRRLVKVFDDGDFYARAAIEEL